MTLTEHIISSFWERVDKRGPNECWEWRGSRNSVMPHGKLWTRGMRGGVYAHRISWMIHNGPIPERLCVLHKCDNPPCVNPAHLFLGTKQDNTIDMFRKGRGRPGRVQGEKNGISKLTEKAVREIRSKHATGRYTQDEIAAEYGVTAPTVWKVIHRYAWRHIE